MVQNIAQIYRTNGITGYYQGLSITIVGVFPYAAFRQATFDILKNNVGKKYFE